MKLALCIISFTLATTYAALTAFEPLLISDQMSLHVDISDNAQITMTGPDDTWFGIGFNNTIMDGTYSIIATVDENGTSHVEEWLLGRHQRGSLIDDTSIEIISDTLNSDTSVRTIVVQRPITGSIYSFPSIPTTIPIIASDGNEGDVEYATSRAMGQYEIS